MKKHFKRNNVSASDQVEPNVTDLINQIQQQLVSLEKKVDILISQSSSQPSERHSKERYFPKPFRSAGQSYHYGKGRQEGSFRERSFTQAVCAECGKDCEVPFKPSADRPVYCRDCFSKRKGGDSFRGKRERDSGEENQGFGRRKKPFFRRRRERD